MTNVIFFGSSAYSLPLIEALRSHFDLRLIVTRPDKPVGRKQILTASPPKQFGIENNIPVITPETLRERAIDEELQRINPDIAIVADYGLIIPRSIFEVPRYQTINIHFSRLPQFPGPSPVQYSILNGEERAWITFMLIEEGLDTVPLVFQKEFPLSSFATTGTLYTHLFEEAAKLLPDVINGYIKGTYISKTQNSKLEARNSITTKHITKPDAFIPWNLIEKAIAGSDIEKS